MLGLAVVIGFFIYLTFRPSYLRYGHPPKISCINNLRQIDGAKQQWALEHNAASNAVPVWSNIQPYLGRGTGGTLPVCPAGGIYTINSLTNAPTCSIKDHVLN
jgi:hypothetical protein